MRHAISSTPIDRRLDQATRARPHATAISAVENTLRGDVPKRRAVSFHVSDLAQLDKHHRKLPVALCSPLAHGSVPTVTPHLEQSTRPAAYRENTAVFRSGTN